MPQVIRGEERGRTHALMENMNPSTFSKPVMTKLQNLFGALVIMDIFQMKFKFSLFTVDVLCNFCYNIVSKVLCMQTCRMSTDVCRSVCTHFLTCTILITIKLFLDFQ